MTPWTVARQAPSSMGFSRQEYWSELPFPSSGDLPDPGIEPGSPALQADSLPTEPDIVGFPVMNVLHDVPLFPPNNEYVFLLSFQWCRETCYLLENVNYMLTKCLFFLMSCLSS